MKRSFCSLLLASALSVAGCDAGSTGSHSGPLGTNPLLDQPYGLGGDLGSYPNITLDDGIPDVPDLSSHPFVEQIPAVAVEPLPAAPVLPLSPAFP